jgi:hypothetical protein
MKNFKKIICFFTIGLLLSGMSTPLTAKEASWGSFVITAITGLSFSLGGMRSICYLHKKNLWWSLPLTGAGYFILVNIDGIANQITNYNKE